MHCPHCSTPLRLVEDVPASLLDRFVVLACPAKSCGKEIVASVRWQDGLELDLLRPAAVRARAFSHILRAQRGDLVFPVAAASGTAGLTMFLAVWQILSPSPPPADNTMGVLAICAGGAAVVVGFGAAIMFDLWLGARSWQRTLERPLLNLRPLPRTYRE